jgi:proline iminopeptidase
VLSGIFTASRRELDWIEQGQFRSHYPEVWERFLERTPASHHKSPAAYHYKNILGNDEQLVCDSAIALRELESNIMNLDDRPYPVDATAFDPTGGKILAHYFTNNCFMPDRYILDNAHKLTMPVWMVHGRYDMDCPPITAYELDKELPNSHLIWAISNHRAEHETANILRTILLHLAERT